MKYRLKADPGGNDRYLPSQYEAESYVHVNGREGFGCHLAGLGERANLGGGVDCPYEGVAAV